MFLKLDISRAFDSLSWRFLFEVMESIGFGSRWMRWVAILLQTASTKIIVNGIPGESIAHACGLRQGDPISPMLFVIAMDVLTAMIKKATEVGVLSTTPGISPTQRLSIYADDVAMLIKPTCMDLSFIRNALDAFGTASGLRVNYRKSSAIAIRGDHEDKARVATFLECN